MAEKSGDLPVTMEGTKPNESSPRRSSMSKVSSSNNSKKVLPHYLRASTGSCHDICKYGRKPASEAKDRHPLRNRIGKSAPKRQSPIVTVLVPERKKMSVEKSPVSKSSFDIPEVEIIKREIFRSSPGDQIVNASPAGQNPVKSEVQSGMKNTSSAKIRNPPKSKSLPPESFKFRMQEVSSSSEEMNVSSVPSKSEETNLSPKIATSKKLKSPITKTLSMSDQLGGLSGGRNCYINLGKNLGHPIVAVKIALTSPRLPLASPRASLSPQPSKAVVKEALASSRLSLASPAGSSSSKSSTRRVASLKSRKHKGLEPVSALKNQAKVEDAETDFFKKKLKQAGNNQVDEKTLYVIKVETERKSLESDQNASCDAEVSLCPSSLIPKCFPTSPSSSLLNEDREESEYTEMEAEGDCLSESKHEESMSLEGEESLGGEHQGKPKKDGVIHSKEKDSQAIKLRFRRGKIVDIQSESNSPRRLKFRRGRVVGQNQNPKADGKRYFAKRGADDQMHDSKPGSEKVVLRHQDVRGKKDSQVLFNNVIEQTASRLVESRKSKVKALVGAFETVINLHHSKPSANIVN